MEDVEGGFMDISSQLIDIVGKDRMSNSQEELFIYSRDPGAQAPPAGGLCGHAENG